MSAKDYSPNVVASSFIKQYYEMMAKHPENLHKFYNEDSHFLHSDLNHASGISGNGPESIRAAISALNLKNTKVDLSNGYIDAQKSTNNGVVVVVVGQLSFPNGGVGKPFVQSFLLSNQASSAYYVSNSVFRLLVPSEEQGDINSVLVNLAPPAAYTQPAAATTSASAWTAPEQPAAASPAPEESSAASAVDASGDRLSGYVAVESLLQEAANEADAEPVPEPAAAPVAEVEAPAPEVIPAPVAVLTATVAVAAVAAVAAAAPAAPVDPLKKWNYSDIVKKLGSDAPAPAVAPAVVRRAPAPTPVAAPAPVSTVHSIYIKQVPEAATAAELETLFASFGKVVSVDQQAGKSFAFVKFESAAAVQAAVAATAGDKTLSLHGQNLRVEERNTSRTVGATSAPQNNAGRGGRTGGRDGARDNKNGDRSAPRSGDKPRSGDNKSGSRPTSTANKAK